MDSIARWLILVDGAVAASLLPLAVWILLSGLDDLVVLFAWLRLQTRTRRANPSPIPAATPHRRIAIFVPCWHEGGVIANMVNHNLSAIRYHDYVFFIGAYPNDQATINTIRRLQQRSEKVHLCLCPHDGPTSKADCLNWIYQRMLLHEEAQKIHFDIVVTHDAEDLIHPDSLDWINYYAGSYEMIQVPVLPLATPWFNLTHGLYCDDFAECHTKDMEARQALGGFLPSSGVGTGYTREALELLAAAESNRIFEPASLTEDYENGLRLQRLGCRQIFISTGSVQDTPVATREYFPKTFRSALKQRTRWVTGIALQGWERYGWSGGARQIYWMWHDRKGLIGNLVSAAANLVLLYGVLRWLLWILTVIPAPLPATVDNPLLRSLLPVNLALLVVHQSVRMICVSRYYGRRFALGVPLRTIYGNWLNGLATTLALARYLRARLRHVPLVWVKTEHAYPSHAALLPHKRPLEEILLGSLYLTAEELEKARATKPAGVRLSEHLVHSGLLSEEELYEALSLQLGLALGKIEPREVHRNVARMLPARVVREWNVLPVRIEAGNLHLATPDTPSEELQEILHRFTRLEVRVELVTPTNFRRLAEQLL